MNRLRNKKHVSDHLTCEEIQDAESQWLQYLQKKQYTDIFASLAAKKSNNLVNQLDVSIDKHGLLRCGGRLSYANLSEAARFPILLPPKERLTFMIIERIHRKTLHSGVSQTLSEIRHKFWIPHGRATVCKVLNECRVCRKLEGGPYKLPYMASLPRKRVSESTPFSRVGVDSFGPLYIKDTTDPQKVWICLFTCLVTRAVHLELVEDMTTSAFLMCLRRFIAIRGTPIEIISDNAKHFKLASDTLKLIWTKMTKNEEVQDYISSQSIKWTFIVELAPWMGGFYERRIGLVKRALR